MNDNRIKSEFFSDNHLTNEALALFAEAIILGRTKDLPIEVQNHVEDCKHCKTEIMAIHETIKSHVESNELEQHPYFCENKKVITRPLLSKTSKTLMLAASVLIVFSVLFWLAQPKHNNQYDHKIISDKPTTKNNGDAPKETENKANDSSKGNNPAQITYKTYELFENMIASNYRSSDFKVIEPSLNQRYNSNQPIVFKFKGNFSSPLELLVFTNEGKKLFTKDTITTPTYILPVNLKPGLYYWKVLNNDDLLCICKFIIN